MPFDFSFARQLRWLSHPVQSSVMPKDAPSLAGTDLTAKLSKKEYPARLLKAQYDLFALSRQLLEQGTPMVLVFEGWDAAGKGGVIKRINENLDPRGFHVHPTSAPTGIEIHQHYLQRFWDKLPQRGHIAVFDRSWYGRVLVERVEGFAEKSAWKRAYSELNAFEQMLTDDGFIVRKYFLHITKETQLKRFEERKDNPIKRWKLTDEDWRNREKWKLYEDATEDMLRKTHQKNAPWNVVSSVCKRHARVAVIEDLVKAATDFLNKKKAK